jgi:hypothetical protein
LRIDLTNPGDWGLIGSTYGHQAGDSNDNVSSGTMTAFRYALEEGDNAWFYLSACVVVVCLIAAVGALVGRTAPIRACAIALWFLASPGMMTIALFVLPPLMVLLVSAVLLTLARYEARTR